MKRKTIFTIGDIVIDEEVYNSDVIGGKFIATNNATGEVVEKTWRKKHGNRNNRLSVLADCVAILAPKEPEVQPEESDEAPAQDPIDEKIEENISDEKEKI